MCPATASEQHCRRVALGHMITADFFRETVIGGNPGDVRPEHLAQVLDGRFASSLADDSYFALLVGVIDESKNRLSMMSGRFPSPLLLRRPDAAIEIGEGGPPVALVPHAQFDRATVDFSPGDRLLVYSDGIIGGIQSDGGAFRQRAARGPGDITARKRSSRSVGRPDRCLAGLVGQWTLR